MTRGKRSIGALATAGAVAAAFGGGVVTSTAADDPTDPQGAAPATEPGRQVPTTPAQTTPAPAATTPAATAPATTTPAATTPAQTTPAKAPEAEPEDGATEEPEEGVVVRRKKSVLGELGKEDAKRTPDGCAPADFVAQMTDAERAAYLREHPTCLPDGTRAAGTGGGAPSAADPSYALAVPGPAPIGVPNFFIEKFRIPPFLLPIYQAAGIEHGIRWEVLAAINEIETDYGRNLNVSSAGALGWMQFMPATWKAYGVDANGDGQKDPYNPVDAIFAAANYLKAAGAQEDLRKAVFAYNHADWYVDSVLLRARLIGGMPSDLVGSLTGLTQGRFPVHATATYAGALTPEDARRRVQAGRNAAMPVESSARRKGVRIFAKPGSPVIAAQDGEVVAVGRTDRLGRFVRVRDVYGNTYTYAQLGAVVKSYPVPKPAKAAEPKPRTKDEVAPDDVLDAATGDAAGSGVQLQQTESIARVAAGITKQAAGTFTAAPSPFVGTALRAAAQAQSDRTVREPAAKAAKAAAPKPSPKVDADAISAGIEPEGKERLFANPARPRAARAGGEEQLRPEGTYTPADEERLGLDRDEVVFKRLKVGAKVVAGTTIGRIGRVKRTVAPHLLFEVRPAGKDAPRIDPKPILDGWKLLESTAIYRAAGRNPFFGSGADTPTVGQILLMSKEALVRRVLENPRIEVYEGGRADIRAGQIDRRVLASLEFLAASGLRPTVSSLRTGHGFYTASGNVSHHSSGNAVDISRINGVSILGHQGSGSITDMAIRRLLTLQGTMKPAQIISLMTFDGADNTLALPDHGDHIHVGWAPEGGGGGVGPRPTVIRPEQWLKLSDRLGKIDNPVVRRAPSKYSLAARKPAGTRKLGGSRASRAHQGE